VDIKETEERRQGKGVDGFYHLYILVCPIQKSTLLYVSHK
jgi:hypothetical protein